MQTYVTLWKYTKEGLMDIKKTPKRFEFVKKVINSAGGKLLSIYGLVGEYDVVTVMEMPDEKAAAATILKICSTGRITSQTMIALSVHAFLKIAKEV
ncbi:MAG: GYD domain-containing protein [Deltaproteobacteria bacterium]|nr:GYD domain-containing protein [Deltaproteobacteria bacterium]